MGIIDILVEYGVQKKAETFLKSFKHDVSKISSVNPVQYCTRFIGFLENSTQLSSTPQNLVETREDVKGYLTSALKAKDAEKLEEALRKAKELKMGNEVKEVLQAATLLVELKKQFNECIDTLRSAIKANNEQLLLQAIKKARFHKLPEDVEDLKQANQALNAIKEAAVAKQMVKLALEADMQKEVPSPIPPVTPRTLGRQSTGFNLSSRTVFPGHR